MANLIDILESFNRKERFYLLTYALGLRQNCEERRFGLGQPFREALQDVLKSELSVTIPKDKVFVATDYQLDWVHGSLALTYFRHKKVADDSNGKPIFDNKCGEVTGTHEDIDLLVAFEASGKFHLLFIEAKGYLPWDSKQLCNKAKRLGKIFGNDGRRYCDDVVPYFVLMSESEPQIERWKHRPDKWPKWMHRDESKLPYYLKNALPDKRKKRIVERCNRGGDKGKCGGYFHCPCAQSLSGIQA